MKPIEIQILGLVPKSPQEICAEFLKLERWSDFTGYSILPGIQSARFETQVPGWVGSRIRVQNTDGTSHLEEIIEWDVERRIALKFQDFTPPLRNLAAHFIETWEFRTSPAGTEIIRRMSMHSKNWLGWLMLLPISRLMKKAFEQNANQMGGK